MPHVGLLCKLISCVSHHRRKGQNQRAKDCRGNVVRGQEHVATSGYEEDVYPKDHTSIWGSYWEDGKWGYACCKSFLKNCMCLGRKADAVLAANAANMAANAERIHAERATETSVAVDKLHDQTGMPWVQIQGIVCLLTFTACGH
jgi:hypothetical protein